VSQQGQSLLEKMPLHQRAATPDGSCIFTTGSTMPSRAMFAALGAGVRRAIWRPATLNYKLNNFVTSVLEESYYRTRAVPLTATGTFPLFQGRPNRQWKDFRTEFGPIISF
jgi:hypothetical protein